MTKAERRVLNNVIRRLKGEHTSKNVEDALTRGDVKLYLCTWVIPALKIMASEPVRDRDMRLAEDLSRLPIDREYSPLPELRWGVDDIFEGTVEADDIFEIRKWGIKKWAERVFDTVDGTHQDGVFEGQDPTNELACGATIRCDLSEIQEHGEWLLSRVVEQPLYLREDGDFLWLDDGVLAIPMHGMDNSGLAESDMRLYAHGQWSARDVIRETILPSADVKDLKLIAAFRDDSLTVFMPGPTGREYLGMEEA